MILFFKFLFWINSKNLEDVGHPLPSFPYVINLDNHGVMVKTRKWTWGAVLLSKTQNWFQFTPFCPLLSFFCFKIQFRSHIAFSCVPFIFSTMWEFPSWHLSFMTLVLFMNTGQLFLVELLKYICSFVNYLTLSEF